MRGRYMCVCFNVVLANHTCELHQMREWKERFWLTRVATIDFMILYAFNGAMKDLTRPVFMVPRSEESVRHRARLWSNGIVLIAMLCSGTHSLYLLRIVPMYGLVLHLSLCKLACYRGQCAGGTCVF